MKNILVLFFLLLFTSPYIYVSGVGPKAGMIFSYIKENKGDLEKIWRTSPVKLAQMRELASDKRLNIIELQQLIYFLNQHERVDLWLNLPFVKRQKLSESEKIQQMQKTDIDSEQLPMVSLLVETVANGTAKKNGINRPFLFSWSFVRFLHLHLAQTFTLEELQLLKSLQKSVFYQLGLKMGWVTEEDLLNEIKSLQDNNASDFLWLSRPVSLYSVGHFYEVSFHKKGDIIVISKNDNSFYNYQISDESVLKKIISSLKSWEKIPKERLDINLSNSFYPFSTLTPAINISGMSCWINGKMVFLTKLFPQLEDLFQSYLYSISKKYIGSDLQIKMNVQKIATKYTTKGKAGQSPLLTDILGRPSLFHQVLSGETIPSDKIYSFLPNITKRIILGDIIEKKDELKKEEFNKKDIYGLLPLHWAIAKGDKNIFEYILNRSNITSETILQDGLLDFINERKISSFIELIRSKISSYQLFKFYLNTQNEEQIKAFIMANPQLDYNITDDGNVSLWQRIVATSNIKSIIMENEKMPKKINLLHRDAEDKNILHHIFSTKSARLENYSFLNYYIKDDNTLKILINQKDKFNKTPAYYAISSSWEDIVCNKRLAKLIDINLTNTSFQNTLLHRAAQENSLEGVKCLLDHSAIQIDIRNQYQVTPLHLASAKGNLEIVKLLVRKGADLSLATSIDGSESDAFRFAIKENKLQTAEYLLSAMIDRGQIKLFFSNFSWAKNSDQLVMAKDKLLDLFQSQLENVKRKLVTLDNIQLYKEYLSETHDMTLFLRLSLLKDSGYFIPLYYEIKDDLNKVDLNYIVSVYADAKNESVVNFLLEKSKEDDILDDNIKKIALLKYKTALKLLSNKLDKYTHEQKKELLMATINHSIYDKEIYTLIDKNLESLSLFKIIVMNGSYIQIKNYLDDQSNELSYTFAEFINDYKFAKNRAYSINLLDISDIFMKYYPVNLRKMDSLEIEEFKKNYLESPDEIKDIFSYLLVSVCSDTADDKVQFIIKHEKEKISDENITVLFKKILSCRTEQHSIKYLGIVKEIQKNIKWNFDLLSDLFTKGYFQLLEGKGPVLKQVGLSREQKDELLTIVINSYPQQEKWTEILLPNGLNEQDKKDYLKNLEKEPSYKYVDKIASRFTRSLVPIKDSYYISNEDEVMKFDSQNKLVWKKGGFPICMRAMKIKNSNFMFTDDIPQTMFYIGRELMGKNIGYILNCHDGGLINKKIEFENNVQYASCRDVHSVVISGHVTSCYEIEGQKKWSKANSRYSKIIFHDDRIVITSTDDGLIQAFEPKDGKLIWEKAILTKWFKVALKGLIYIKNRELITLDLYSGVIMSYINLMEINNAGSIKTFDSSIDGKHSAIGLDGDTTGIVYLIDNYSGHIHRLLYPENEFIVNVKFIPSTQKLAVLTNTAKNSYDYEYVLHKDVVSKFYLYDAEKEGAIVSEHRFPHKNYINEIIVGPKQQLAIFSRISSLGKISKNFIYILSAKDYFTPQKMQKLEVPKNSKRPYWGTKELDQLYIQDYDYVYIYAKDRK